jgi:hypothetical protein
MPKVYVVQDPAVLGKVRAGVADLERDRTVSLEQAYHDWMRNAREREDGRPATAFRLLTGASVIVGTAVGWLLSKVGPSRYSELEATHAAKAGESKKASRESH